MIAVGSQKGTFKKQTGCLEMEVLPFDLPIYVEQVSCVSGFSLNMAASFQK